MLEVCFTIENIISGGNSNRRDFAHVLFYLGNGLLVSSGPDEVFTTIVKLVDHSPNKRESEQNLSRWSFYHL